MDVLDFINRGGQKTVPNPNYNARSKKNKQPRTIITPDLDANNDDAVKMAIVDFNNQYSIGSREADVYRKQGINWNPWENLDKQVAEQQGALSKFGNALAQTVVSEIGLGTAIGITDLFDMIGQAVGASDENYQNPLSQYLTEKQEEFKEATKIWVDPKKNIANGGLLDAGWWASNIPSVASSLTLLLPSSGVVKGLSWLGKTRGISRFTRNAVRALSGAERRLKYARDLRAAGASAEEIQAASQLTRMQRFLNSSSTISATNLFLENGTTAALSRAMENYQEARQTYNDMYANASETLKKLKDSDKPEDKKKYEDIIERSENILKDDKGNYKIDINDPDAVAKVIAKTSADKTFQIDWINVGWDVLQMYGLRNAWKGLKNAPDDPIAVRRANREAALYFGKSAEQVAKLKAERKFVDKAKERIGDWIFGGKTVIAAELSEGAEEALNYVAQQEGMTYGNILLGTEKTSSFDNRLSKYIQSPEMYDAAFWGVMGGVIFQGLGSQFRRISNKLTNKSEADKKAAEQLPWYELDELPEIKRRKAEIEARGIDFTEYAGHMEKINNNIDIYHPNADGSERTFTSNAEKEAARKRLKEEYITKMTLRAMNSGNLDMLKEFLANDNIRKGMVERGIFNEKDKTKTEEELEQESKKYIEDALDIMEKVERSYDEELIALDYAASNINARRRKENKKANVLSTIPAEYLQIMAVNNIKTKMAIETLNQEKVGVEQRISELEKQFEKELDENLPYRNAIRTAVLTATLGQLRAERKRLVSQEEKSLSNQFAIENIDKKIETIEDKLEAEDLAYATWMSLRYVKGDDGKFTQEDTEESIAYKDTLIEKSLGDALSVEFNIPGLEHLSSKSRTSLAGDAAVGKFRTMEADYAEVYRSLRNISPELDELYQETEAIDYRIDSAYKDIVHTADDVEHEAAMLNNTMNEVRVKAINEANKTIQDLYEKYGNSIRTALYDKLQSKRWGRDFDDDVADLSESEKKRLSDAIDILNLSKDANKSLVDKIEELFNIQDMIKAGKELSAESEEDTEEGESSTTLNLSDTDANSVQPIDSSASTQEGSGGSESGQIDDVSQVENPQNIENRNPTSYAKWYPKQGKLESGRPNSTDNGGSAIYDNGDGTFTIDVRNDAQMLNNPAMFSNANEVDLTRPYKVEEFPIAKKRPNGKLEIVSPGILVNTDTLEYQQEHQVEEEAQPAAPANEGQGEQPQGDNSSTGELQPIVNFDAVKTYLNEHLSISELEQLIKGEKFFAYDDVIPEDKVKIQELAKQVYKEKTGHEYGVTRTLKTADEVINQAPADFDAKMQSLTEFAEAVRANHDVDLDAKAQEIINRYVTQGIDRTVATNAVNWAKSKIKIKVDQRKNRVLSLDSLLDEFELTDTHKTNIKNNSISTLRSKALVDSDTTIDEHIEAIKEKKKELDRLKKEREDTINNFGRDYLGLPEVLRGIDASMLVTKHTIEQHFVAAYAKLNKNKSKSEAMRSAITEVLITQSAITELVSDTPEVKAYKDAVRAMINQYANVVGIRKINDKIYINLEDLLRYTNEVTTDSETAAMLYNSMKTWLISSEAQKEFVTTDKEEINKADFLKNVARSARDRYMERLADVSTQRVDIRSFVQSLIELGDTKSAEEFYEALDELQPGDKLHTERFGALIHIKDSKGRTVGTLPIPKINATTGAYEVYNDGWKTDVLATGNGNIRSEFKNLLTRWLTSNDTACQELNDIIFQLAYDNLTGEERGALLVKLENNAEWIRAQKLGFTRDDATRNQLANGLVKLWKFTKRNNDYDRADYVDLINESLDAWFQKLKFSYDAVKALEKGAGGLDISVATISDGELVRIVENDKIKAQQEALPADKAIAGGVNPEIHKIAVADTLNKGWLDVSGMPIQPLAGVFEANTFVLLPNRSGRPGYVHAYPAEVADDYIGSDAKEIMKAIHDEVNRLLNEHANNPSDETYNAIKEFFRTLTDYKNENRTLFNGLTFADFGNGFSVTMPKTNNYFIIYAKAKSGGPSTLVTVGNESYKVNSKGKKTMNFPFTSTDAHKAIQELISSLSFKINYSYVHSDNVSDQPMKGFATKRNGKFEITIAGKTWSYNSFNEFILNNNLVRLNTKPTEDGKSNYHRRGVRSQAANQVFEIKIAKTATPPVGSNRAATPVATPAQEAPVTISLSDRAKSILKSTDTNVHKGNDIAALIFGDEKDKDKLNALKNLDILPKSIIFDEKFNDKIIINVGTDEKPIQKTIDRKDLKSSDKIIFDYATINAEVDPKTGQVTVGSKWLKMFTNPLTQKQAIRKLMHEQLHYKLHKKRGFVRSAKEIYDAYKEALDKEGLPADDHMRAYLFEGESEEVALEEFIIETLTSKELADKLNSIDVPDVKRHGGVRNLLQQVMELMRDVFGWDIKRGTLYEKEFYTLKEAFKDTTEENQAKDAAAETVNKIIEDGEKVSLTKDELYYIDEATGQIFVRVTSAIQADDDNLDENGIPHRFDKNSPWITPSTNIGTGIDEFVRDFFLDKLDSMSEDELEQNYPNATGEDLSKFREQLKEFKDNLLKGKIVPGKKITIVSRDIKANGQVDVKMPDGTIKQLNVNGTLDLLGYDQDGKFYVFDMKTVHSDGYISDQEKNKKWNRQLQLYKQFLEKKYGIEVDGCYIIPIKVNYDTPKGATLKNGTDMGGTAEYTVKNPELKTEYDNPNRTQLLQDGVEFKDAQPELRPILKKRPSPGSIQYKNLEDNAKAILDGKITAKDYEDGKVPGTVQTPKTPTVVPPVNPAPVENKFGDGNAVESFIDEFLLSSITEDIKVTSEIDDIKAKAIADGTFMKAPNGKPTNLNERQWLQVRTTAFKDWFGDWETVGVLDDMSMKLPLFEDAGLDDGRVLYEPNFRFFINGTPIGKMPIDSKTFKINGFGVGEEVFINPKFRGKGYGKKMYIIAARYAKEKGHVLESEVEYQLNENSKRVWNSLIKDNKAYFDETSKTYKIKNENIGINETNASKVVDENGEPRVVYHRSPNKFDIFDTNKFGTSTDWGQHGRGFYFGIQDNRVTYYDNKYEVFLNIKNPYYVTDYDTDWISYMYNREYNQNDSSANLVKRKYTQEKINELKNYDGVIDLQNNLYSELPSGKKVLVTTGLKKDIEFVVPNPNQIKSATYNVGTFSTTDDNIRHSSITEYTPKVASVTAFTDRLPVSQQAKFSGLYERGEVESACQ